jgi:hypothetical protein
VAIIGCVIASLLFPVLSLSVLLDLMGVIENPYFGFLIYMVMGPIFTLGMILIGVGVFSARGGEDIGLYTLEYIREQLSLPGRFTRVRKLLFLISFLTVCTIVLVAVISYTGFRYSESVSFCSQFCHKVMEPEFVSYRNSPHSQIPCVRCHIAEGAGWLTRTKLSGFRQLFAVAFDTYPRPIMPPGEGLRPTRETCEQCHRPEMFHGDRLHVYHKYRQDRENTHVQTVMLLRVGSGGYSGEDAHGIHWHISPMQTIRYTHTDPARKNIVSVTVRHSDGTEKVFRRKGVAPGGDAGRDLPPAGTTRLMDCMDCHNRPTHVFLPLDKAIDRRIATGEISAAIPFIKQQAVRVLAQEYAGAEEARVDISRQLHDWYGEHFPEYVGEKKVALNMAVQGIYQAYAENIFPRMRITWNTYEDFIGHGNDSGCFRCHNDLMVGQDGKGISRDCRICHIVLANEEENPEILKTFKVQQP